MTVRKVGRHFGMNEYMFEDGESQWSHVQEFFYITKNGNVMSSYALRIPAYLALFVFSLLTYVISVQFTSVFAFFVSASIPAIFAFGLFLIHLVIFRRDYLAQPIDVQDLQEVQAAQKLLGRQYFPAMEIPTKKSISQKSQKSVTDRLDQSTILRLRGRRN